MTDRQTDQIVVLIMTFVMGFVLGIAVTVLLATSKDDMSCEVHSDNGDLTRYEVCTGEEYIP
jgi:hypothetical protein